MTTTSCNSSVGPNDLIESLGVEVVVAGYTVLVFITSSLFLYAFYLRLTTCRPVNLLETYEIFFPALVCLAAILPVFSPVLYQLTSLVQDFLATLAMLMFMNHTRDLLGGEDELVLDGSRCPLGTPPLCCLRPCFRPRMTKKMMQLILLPIRLIVVLNFVVIIVNTSLAYNFFPPPKEASDVANIPSYLLIPFQVTAMYTYKVFMSYLEPRLIGTFPRTRGRLVLVVFILCKATQGIFSMLEGYNVFDSLDGLSCVKYSQLMLPMVQLGLLLPISLILPRVYTRKWTQIDGEMISDMKVQQNGDGKDDAKNVDEREENEEEHDPMMESSEK